ncbi:aminoglycoside phosphotransferase family protein (plasmid) [Nocardia sp. NBC_01377]|uniref:phosphotransferase enzyme family protein n=1 Tax=Nocardia sp. NBC_01377 TaxID=2903595 RepID=UPI002F916507
MTQLSRSASDELQSSLAEICRVAGLDDRNAKLIKYTNNVVWHLATAPVIVRIGVGEIGRTRAPRVVRLANWLAENDAPVPRLHPGIEQPVVTSDTAATIWEWLPGSENHWDITDLAVPLRTLHALEPPEDASLPRWDPFAAAQRRLAAADPALPAPDLAWIDEQWQQVEDDYFGLRPQRCGIVHGDAHTGNLLCDHHGRAVLCDLDSAGYGPLAWDLATSAVDAVRFGASGDHERLASAYGYDVTTDPAWSVLRRIRELGLITSVIPDLARRPAVAAEHARRLAALRQGDSTTRWRPYR